jgi:S-DNA-T family DNA segregation ATPase FtsK/SpoIIIE
VSVEYLDRPPRILPELPQGEVEIPNPPEKDESRHMLQHLLLPFISIFGYVLISLTGQGRNPYLLVPMAFSAIATSIFAVYSIRQEKKEREALMAAYEQRLTDLRREMEEAHNVQRTFYWYNYPNVDKLLEFASGIEVSRSGSRLWERRPSDLDFGAIRLGVGTLPSTVVYKVAKAENREDPQMKDAEKIAEDSLYLDEVPITIPLRYPVGSEKAEEEDQGQLPRHSLGVVGRNIAKTSDFIRAVATHFTAFHSPLDTRLFVVGTPEARKRWEWAVWLPHTNSRSESYLGDQMCFDPESIPAFWDMLMEELDKRQLRLQDKDSGDVTLPFLLVFVDKLDSQEPESPLSEVESEAAVSLILQRGPELGAAIVFLVSEAPKIPSDCQGVIEVEPVGSEVVFRYAEIGLNTPRYIGTADTLDPIRAEKSYAQLIKDYMVRRSFGEDISTYVTLLELLNANRIEEIPILENWTQSRLPEGAEWLGVPLGLMGANKVRGLIFHADEDGVHGMIAGTTGSGKSELLLTLIAGLAIRYDPSILNFVLVDYKGGSAFEPFRELPHCVDIATNLEGNAVERMFIAIKAELDRRGKILKDYNVKHIVEYRKKGYHLEHPFPHLFIIVDEFAEMVAENAEYKARFDSITRLGRAIGVSLILATQRPTGAVTDQMRANMKFRICLRVETTEDSRELLKRSDAAYLPSNIPGRAYVQVGSDQLSLMQVARAGGSYSVNRPTTLEDFVWLEEEELETMGSDGKGGNAEQEILDPEGDDSGIMNETSDVTIQGITDKLGGQQPETLVDWIVGYTAFLAEKEDVQPQSKPWPDPLPEQLPLNLPISATYINTARSTDGTIVLCPEVAAWLEATGKWLPLNWRGKPLSVDIGIVDNPYDSEQRILNIDLTRGPLVLFGASGWGKSTFLRTLMLALAATHSPGDLHMYALDFGKGGLNAVKALPHLGASIDATEEARVERLMRMLANILESRRHKVMQYGSLSAYNADNPDAILPAVVVLIDNFAEFKEGYDKHVPMLLSLVRDGRAFGLYFVVTASQVSDLPGKLYNLFTERMSFKLPDITEYIGIVGRGAPRFNDVAGRGVVNVNRTPLEFQTAIPLQATGIESDLSLEEGGLYEDIAQAMSSVWSGDLPEPVEILPEVILLEDLLTAQGEKPKGLQVITGLNDLDRKPTSVDLEKLGPHFLLIGPPLSGKTTALRTWILSMAATHTPEELGLVLVDPKKSLFQYGGRHTFENLPHVLKTISEPEDTDSLIKRLQSEYEGDFIRNLLDRSHEAYVKQDRPLVIVFDNYDEIGSVANHREIETLGEFARKYGSEGLHFVLGGSLGILRARDDLLKQVESPRYSLVLQDAEAVRSLGGKLPYGSVKAEYPPGRGFIVKSVRTQLTQTAMPYNEIEENVELVLDSWVDRIVEEYEQTKATWSYQGADEGLDEESSATHIEVAPMLDDLEMDPELEEEFYRQLEEMGMKPPDRSKSSN